MDNKKVASELLKIAKDILADTVLTDKDKKVLDAFIDQKPLSSKKLESDGKKLDGLWSGGNGLAHWKEGKIEFGEGRPHTKSDQTILNALKRMTPKKLLASEMIAAGKTFTYYINLDERGSFDADVRDPKEKTVFEIKDGNELEEDETSIFEDGFMRDKDDLNGLEKYLKHLGIMKHGDKLVEGN